MACSCNKVTSHRWQFDNFREQRDATYRNNGQIFGSNFTLAMESSVSFALVLQFSASGLNYTTFGVVLKEFDDKKSLEVDLKIWLENDAGQKFYVNSAQKKAFEKVGEEYKVRTISNGNDYNLFRAVYNNHGTLFICCEITKLNWRTSNLQLLQESHQNNWSMYEKEIHDTIIKVGDTEFKILKTFFMSQSDVFTQMFSSSFKEGVTSKVEINDIDEDTMQHLIKWFYTIQIDDESKAEKLFKVAEKYNIKLLKKTCTEILLSTLDNDNTFARFILGVIHNGDQLKEGVLNFITKLSTAEAMNLSMSTEWIEFVRKNASVADEVCELMRQKFKTGES